MSTSPPEHVYFVFVDGVGLGSPDQSRNPLARADLDGLSRYTGGQAWTQNAECINTGKLLFRPVDATLQHDGLPQSGTGQATLFTGVDCIAAAGRHFGPFPHSQNKSILRQQNVFSQITDQLNSTADPVAFANAYPEIFFQKNRQRKRWTVTTFCCDAAGVRLRTSADLKQGLALTAGLTRRRWNTVGDPVEEITTQAAAHDFHRLGALHRFTLYEFFLTDKAGHRQDMAWAEDILRALSSFLGEFHDLIDPEKNLLLISSDHGNIEDLSIKTHTRNPVPLVAYGKGHHAFTQVESIAGIVPALISLYQPIDSSWT